MNAKLVHTCAALWGLGFLGLWVLRGLFDLGPGALAFELCARLGVVGAVGYAVLGALSVRQGHRAAEPDAGRR